MDPSLKAVKAGAMTPDQLQAQLAIAKQIYAEKAMLAFDAAAQRMAADSRAPFFPLSLYVTEVVHEATCSDKAFGGDRMASLQMNTSGLQGGYKVQTNRDLLDVDSMFAK